MGLFDFFKKKKSAEVALSDAYEDDERFQHRIGQGLAIESSVKASSEQARVKYTKPAYNPQARREFYDDGSAHKAAIDRAFSGGETVRDPYSGAELLAKQRDAKIKYGTEWQNHAAEADHIDPLAQVVGRHQSNPFLTADDLKTVGNADDNFQVLSRKLNQSSKTVGKGGSTQTEWADDAVRMEGVYENSETGDSPEAIQAKIRNTGKAAQRRNDSRLRRKSFRNAVGTAHEAGMAGAQNAGITALTMSGIMNIVSVIRGEKDSEEAITDTINDGGKAAVTGYAMGGGLTVAAQSLSNTSSEFIRGLIDNNVPAKVITAVIVTGDTLQKWSDGEITTQECLIQLGDKGLNMATMGYSMAAGQALIPIPIVGGAVGALVGSLLTSSYYHSLINTLQTNELEHLERMRIIRECELAKEQTIAFRQELENYLDAYFEEYRSCFDSALSSMRLAYEMGDTDNVIASANDITRKLNGKVYYNNVKEFRSFLDSDDVDVF